MATLIPALRYKAFDAAGLPLVGGLLYAYAAGTSTPVDTFTTQAGDTANDWPVELDAKGEADVWLGDIIYDFVLKDADGVLIKTIDDVYSPGSTLGAAGIGADDGSNGSIFTTVQEFIDLVLIAAPVTLEQFGGVGNGTTSDSAAWDLAVATGRPIQLLDKSYRIGVKTIQRDNVVIVGQKMPAFNSARTALTGGSILLGSLLIDGNNVRCENFGVDNGNTYTNTYNGGLGGDAFVSHNIAQLGVLNTNNHFKNIIGLIRIGDYTDPQAAFHGVLLESLISGTAHNIVGVNGWFGVVLKVTDFNCGDLYGIENDSVSVQIKSNSYAPVARVNINNVITKNYAARGYVGFLIVASDAELTGVNVGNVTCQEGLTAVRILAEVVQPVVAVTIGNISNRDAGANGVDVQGPCYGVVLNNIVSWSPAGSGFSTSQNAVATNPVDVTVDTVRVYPSATSTTSVDIGNAATKVLINTVNVAAADGVTLAAGSIINIQQSTTIGQYVGTLKVNGVLPALVNGWASAFGQPTGLVVKNGITQGYGRISAAAATSDVFMTIPSGMRPDNLAFYTTITAVETATSKHVPVAVFVDATGDVSIYPNLAAYVGIGAFHLTDLRFPTEIPAAGAI